jgi:hypothetical protein
MLELNTFIGPIFVRKDSIILIVPPDVTEINRTALTLSTGLTLYVDEDVPSILTAMGYYMDEERFNVSDVRQVGELLKEDIDSKETGDQDVG